MWSPLYHSKISAASPFKTEKEELIHSIYTAMTSAPRTPDKEIIDIIVGLKNCGWEVNEPIINDRLSAGEEFADKTTLLELAAVRFHKEVCEYLFNNGAEVTESLLTYIDNRFNFFSNTTAYHSEEKECLDYVKAQNAQHSGMDKPKSDQASPR